MVKIKFLICTALLIAIASESSGNLLGHHKQKHGRRCSYKGKSVLGCFDYFARGVNRKCANSYDIFTDLASLNDIGSFDASISILLNVSKGGCGIIDFWIPKLGTIYSNMVISVFRIIFCVLGDFKHSKFGVCDKNHGRKWGWKLFDGGYDDVNDVIKCYDLYDPQGDIDKIFKEFGKERKSFSGAQKLVIDSIWDIACLFKRGSKKWHKNDLFSIFKKVVSITAALANCHRSGLGDYVIDGLINYCGKSFKDYGYSEISTCDKELKKELENCNNDHLNGAITPSDEDDSYPDDGGDNNTGNKNNTGNNNGNNNNNNSNGGNQSNANVNNVAQSASNQNANSQVTNVVVKNYIVYKDEDGNEKEKSAD